ncbi:penicillin-binding protein 1B [Solimonas aquatica]|uniref:Penicillin-binding protein 1B n=1 Tax=Solimonas aquatica TaxID=489703 RepID=A0A1H9I7D0_9GAMM|nr:penicillin-binding protein 1B [Solimonas aquatica]SEQ70438.1 penicillin-binding protein 1B [Solimonas aquatica]
MASFSRKLGLLLVSALVLLLSVGGVLLAAYLIKLDGQIRQRFAGARWALPAQVYAAPQELYAGLGLSAAELAHELDRLGYRQDAELPAAGTYRLAGQRLEVQLRGFAFWDGAQAPQKLSISFTGNSLSSVRDGDSGQERDIVRLDPMLIGSIYPKQGEDRVLIKLSDLPALVPKGLVAVEDHDFYSHAGVSIKAILRASFANLRAGHVVQGGSTITQQLIKNFFLSSSQTWDRKINEALMAVLLESHYSKDEILEAYLNEVHLGQDGNRAVHGFGLGAQFYFNKPLSELRPHEVALLVGLVKGASYYNPRRNPQRALDRRNVVLGVFRDEGLLNEQEYRESLAMPLGVVGGRGGGVERYPAFVELVKRQLEQQYKDEDLTNEGLRIFTTLDPHAQEVLETHVLDVLPQLEKARRIKPGLLQASGVITSADRGEVLALVGGRDLRYPGFNRALDSRRSIGSLAKPFVYLTALQQPERYNLETVLPDEPIEVRQAGAALWAPRNYDKQLHGPQHLYMALAQSLNLPTVHLGLELGPAAVLKTMQSAGYSGDAKALPSIFLGAVDASPLEVAQMYGTLAAGGFQAPPSAIREVQTKEGQPLKRFPLQVRQTLPEGPIYLLTWALQKVMQLGTGRAAYSLLPADTVVAGKSGTTDDYRDSWFAGFGADRVTVIWVGRDDNQSTGLSGSAGALPIWARVMRDLHVRSIDPVPPAGVEEVLIEPASGLRADEHCGNAFSVPYLGDSAPQEWAPCTGQNPLSAPLKWLRDIFGN